ALHFFPFFSPSSGVHPASPAAQPPSPSLPLSWRRLAAAAAAAIPRGGDWTTPPSSQVFVGSFSGDKHPPDTG
ncbi:hypothetical protein U9M48_036543, partial [Paspalum notatum var. saurae]